MVGISCSWMFLGFHCTVALWQGRKELTHSFQLIQKSPDLGVFAWRRKNSVGTFGIWSELCVCPHPAVGDDICFIITVSHGIVRYREKPDYDMLLTEHPTLAVILPPFPLFSCSYHYKKKKSRSKILLCRILSAIGITVTFPETLWPAGGKPVHLRILQ